jgi:N-acetylornithine carbamoyltransferase
MLSPFYGRDWIDAELDFSHEEYAALVDHALCLKAENPQMQLNRLLGKTIYLLFLNKSLRTRSSFEAGMTQLGGHASVLDVTKMYRPVRRGHDEAFATERIADVARVLSGYGDAIAVRAFGDPVGWNIGNGNAIIKEFAEYANIPVINMMCDFFHPTQALADMITIREHLGGFRGKKLALSWAYSGSWKRPHSVPNSVLLAAAKMGMDISIACPKGFEFDSEVRQRTRQFAFESGATLNECDSMDEACADADIVYAKSWGSLECFPIDDQTPVNETRMLKLFNENKHWQCTEETMKLAKPEAGYMHCMPVDRGEEVTDKVVDGPNSLVFQQAHNRLHSHKAIMSVVMEENAMSYMSGLNEKLRVLSR